MSEFVTLTATDGHELQAYVARPTGEVLGALVVVQEIFGVNASIRAVANSYAQNGFVAIAPSLFDRFERGPEHGSGVELGYDDEGMKKARALMGRFDLDSQLLDVAAAYEYVKAEGSGPGWAVSVVGFCFGGLMSWLSATRGKKLGMDLKCCVGYYAGGIGKVAAEDPACPVMLHFGAEDDHIGKDQVEAVRSAHPEVEVYVYEGAGHAFANAARTSYRPEAAQLARERTLEFLKSKIA